MGAKSTPTVTYQNFLKLVKQSHGAKGEKNFFDYRNVHKFREAIETEIAEINRVLRLEYDKKAEEIGDVSELICEMGNNAVSKLRKGAEKFASIIEGRTNESSKIDVEDIRELRIKLLRKESTPFLKFAGRSIELIVKYLDATNRIAVNGDVSEFLDVCHDFGGSLLRELKLYRHGAKSHHYFQASEGRAEIANKMTGGSLERWLNNSFTALKKPGTEFFINGKYKYVCRKATNDEESKHPDNKNRPKIFRFNHIICEIVNN